jgi:hypothetical protein
MEPEVFSEKNRVCNPAATPTPAYYRANGYIAVGVEGYVSLFARTGKKRIFAKCGRQI